jgi:multimeric flavodoxin WrbA
MKLIVINGAPRMEKGNTQILLNPFLVGARGAGADVDIAFLGRKKIKQCIGCFTCYAKTPGVCVHSDDMPGLVDRIAKADAMVLATPIYLDGMTALTKTFVDRLVIFLDPHFEKDDMELIHPLRRDFPKKIFVVSVCGYTGIHNFEPLLGHVERISRNLHSQFAGALLRPGAFSLLMTKKYSEKVRSVLEAARLSGEEFVRSGHISKEIFDRAAADICSEDELKKAANSYWDRELGA